MDFPRLPITPTYLRFVIEHVVEDYWLKEWIILRLCGRYQRPAVAECLDYPLDSSSLAVPR